MKWKLCHSHGCSCCKCSSFQSAVICGLLTLNATEKLRVRRASMCTLSFAKKERVRLRRERPQLLRGHKPLSRSKVTTLLLTVQPSGGPPAALFSAKTAKACQCGPKLAVTSLFHTSTWGKGGKKGWGMVCFNILGFVKFEFVPYS